MIRQKANVPTSQPPAEPIKQSGEMSSSSAEKEQPYAENQEKTCTNEERTRTPVENKKNGRKVKEESVISMVQQKLPMKVEVRRVNFNGVQSPLLIIDALDWLEKDQELENGLTSRQEMFCVLMTRDAQCFDNRTLSYSVAYNIPIDPLYGVDDKTIITEAQARANYQYCSMGGSRMMRNDKVKKRYEDLIAENWNEDFVRREHSWLITQRENLPVKLNALGLYYKVEGKITEKSKVTHSLDDILRDITGTGRPEPSAEPFELPGVEAE